MAYEIPVLNVTFVAGGTIAQFKWVELSGDNTVTQCDAATDKPIGVAQNGASSGGEVIVMVIGITKIQGDEALAAGDLIGPSGDGQADKKVVGTDLTHYICGQVITGMTNAGELATAFINCANIARAV